MAIKKNTGSAMTLVAGSNTVATDAIFDAAGDLVQGTGANTAARLALGTAGQVLTVNGGATAAAWATPAAWTVVSRTTTDTAVNGEIVLCDASGGGFVETLPAATSGHMVIVKKTDSSANAITVTPASGTIDGAATLVINTQYTSRTLVADGTNWHVI